MRIKSIRIQNLRSFDDQTIEFGNCSCLVGPNGSGKSTILCALNIFFRETQSSLTNLTSLDIEDFHLKNVEKPITITVTFGELEEEAKKDFAEYYRQEQLVITAQAVFDKNTNKADVKQYGQRLGMEDFKPFFRALGDNAKVAELKAHYEEIRKNYTELPAPGSKDVMANTLKDYEATYPEKCVLIPSGDEFYGFSKGANRLAKYIQWIYVPAVKDVVEEQSESKDTALGKILARTVRAKINFILNDISDSLGKRLSDWAHPGVGIKLQWQQDLQRSIRVEEPFAEIVTSEGIFEGKLCRFGHGLQRSYLLALLQELSSCDDLEGPILILGCDEPELFQHPPQARYLFSIFQKLSEANSQVVLCTHSPYV